MSYVYLEIAIAAEIIATSFLKQAEGFTRAMPSAIAIAGYFVAFCCLSLALRGIPTGAAYAIWSWIRIVAIAVIAWLVHGQTLAAPAMIGMSLIVTSVVVMNVFAERSGL